MRQADTRVDVAVAGGGITGLSAAHYLRTRYPGIRVVVLEAGQRAGGIILTERIGRYVVEAGPDSFLSSKPRGLGLAQELGIESELQGTQESTRRTWVMGGGSLHPLPEGLSGLVPSRLEPLLQSDLFSDEGKARLQQEPDTPPRAGDEDESLAEFVTRRFGSEVYDRMIEALMAGIYAGDGRELSLEATFPQLRRFELEHGSVLRGVSASASAPGVAGRPGFLTPVTGMESIVEALLERLGTETVRLGTEVLEATQRSGGFAIGLGGGETIEARALVLATPAPVTGRLLRGLGFDPTETPEDIPMASSAIIALGYPEAEVPRTREGHGYVVPRCEGRPVLASTWVSSKFEHRAPPGHALIRVFIGRRGADAMLAGTDDDLLQIARHEVAEVLGTCADPEFHRVFRWPHAMPQYTLGHVERIEGVRTRLASVPGLGVAGNWIAGVGIPDCIASGESAAQLAGESALAARKRTA